MKKRDYTLSFLYFFGILMVIDCHTGFGLSFLSNLFPYDSFFMPLFFFCSGYFFTRKPLLLAIKHKMKKILVPYVIWNFVFVCIAYIIDKIIGTAWYYPVTARSFLLSFLGNTLTTLNGPAWFVITLFWVQIIYILVDKVVNKRNKIFDLIITFVSVIVGFISVYLSVNNIIFNVYEVRYIYRILFYFQFYNFGYIFKKYFFKKLQNNSNLKCKFFISTIVINIILILMFGKESIIFPSTSEMAGFNRYIFLPLITSFTGIMFYYLISDFFSKKIGESKIIEFVSQNTFTIMEVHLLFANVINILIFIIKKCNSTLFIDFNSDIFVNGAWLYNYLPNGIVYFSVSFVLSLCAIYFFNYFKKVFRRFYV